MSSAAARQVGRLLLGYLSSALTAAALGYLSLPFLALFQMLEDGDEIVWSGFLNLDFAPRFIAFLSTAVGVFALLPWILIVAYAGRRGIREFRYFISAGLCVAALAVSATMLSTGDLMERFTGYPGSLSSQLAFMVLSLVSGAVAGIVFWAIAGRYPASWQNPKLTLTDRLVSAILRPAHWVLVLYGFAASVTFAMMFTSVLPIYARWAMDTVKLQFADIFSGWVGTTLAFGPYSMLAIPAILFAEQRGIQRITFFVLSGLSTSLLGIVLASDRLKFDNVYQNIFYALAVTGGLTGGLMYWFIAGRHSGASRVDIGSGHGNQGGAEA
jgi:hypothetical protein